jgi:hypothetical protein
MRRHPCWPRIIKFWPFITSKYNRRKRPFHVQIERIFIRKFIPTKNQRTQSNTYRLSHWVKQILSAVRHSMVQFATNKIVAHTPRILERKVVFSWRCRVLCCGVLYWCTEATMVAFVWLLCFNRSTVFSSNSTNHYSPLNLLVRTEYIIPLTFHCNY